MAQLIINGERPAQWWGLAKLTWPDPESATGATVVTIPAKWRYLSTSETAAWWERTTRATTRDALITCLLEVMSDWREVEIDPGIPLPFGRESLEQLQEVSVPVLRDLADAYMRERRESRVKN